MKWAFFVFATLVEWSLAVNMAEDASNSLNSTWFVPCTGKLIGNSPYDCEKQSLDDCASSYTSTGVPGFPTMQWSAGERKFMQCTISGVKCAATLPYCSTVGELVVDYLIVGGGGGAGSGGGGAGGVLKGTQPIKVGEALSVLVGAGGNGGGGGGRYATTNVPTNGGDSKLGKVVAKGGAAGGYKARQTAPSGASGGGSAFDSPSVTVASGTKGQGHSGGKSFKSGYGGGGGGGGAGEAGHNPSGTYRGGKGGDGISSDITGSTKFYGGGGGAGLNGHGAKSYPDLVALGGKGGGGRGSDFVCDPENQYWKFTGTNGEPNTGGGGGGGDPETRMAGTGGSGVVIVRYTSPTPILSGGTVTEAGGFQIHTFATPGEDDLSWMKAGNILIDFLIVAGGGGAGSGGGGGGGVIMGSKMIHKGTEWTVKVGGGGKAGQGGGVERDPSKPATKGEDSMLGSLVAIGGGKGADYTRTPGGGGSGGGGGFDQNHQSSAPGTPGQGFHGGLTNQRGYGAAGGGGGAGEPGGSAPKKHYGGKGGDGVSSDITGALKWYGGGGGGGVNHNGDILIAGGGGAGGKGGGGRGGDFGAKAHSASKARFTGTDGEANTGGGGGGTDPESTVAGKGGSGIVIIRYKSAQPLMTGGTMSSSGGYQIHTFDTVGTSTLKY
ncbi:unnamed protein product [Symbiodinium natans]|uniref:Glycine-rich domain-containing protein n=1 Tax=Symbiodinium natans TaxID=878477 RepID=A0A812U5B8_9DINO|nr:unnamed protein product [Symbiodinium natans]